MRPLLATGHLMDMAYLLAYALVVVPIVVLLGTGFSATLGHVAPWLVLPRIPGIPGWCYRSDLPSYPAAPVTICAMPWLSARVTAPSKNRVRARRYSRIGPGAALAAAATSLARAMSAAGSP